MLAIDALIGQGWHTEMEIERARPGEYPPDYIGWGSEAVILSSSLWFLGLHPAGGVRATQDLVRGDPEPELVRQRRIGGSAAQTLMGEEGPGRSDRGERRRYHLKAAMGAGRQIFENSRTSCSALRGGQAGILGGGSWTNPAHRVVHAHRSEWWLRFG